MTDTQALIQAKSEAIQALATAMASAADRGEIQGTKAAVAYIETWARAIAALLPSEPAEAPQVFPRKFGEGSQAPADLHQVIDKDGDVWERTIHDTWVINPRSANDFGYSWNLVVERWGPVTEVL